MTLKQAATAVVSDVYAWVKANDWRDQSWVKANFTSMVMKSMQLIKDTTEFPHLHRNKSFFASTNMVMRMDNNCVLKQLSFYIPHSGITEFEREHMKLFNTYLADAIVEIERNGLSSYYNNILLDRIERAQASTGQKAPTLIVHDTRKIDSFNFKTS